MPQHQTPLFYFPSMVVFVDDSRNFLDNFSLQLDADLAFQLYDSPIAALTALNAPAEKNSSVEQFFSISRFGDELPLSHHVLDLNLNNIVREAQNPHRFERISVVVVDYDMPEMDGLELCRNIKNHSIKKILLTGKADEKLAVQAFNQGLIDRFIMKQDAEVIPSLNQAIVELQQAYFENMMRRLIEYKAIITRILASNCKIFSRTCNQPVTKPAAAPASAPAADASQGSTPAVIMVAATAPPSGKLPSAVRSGKSRIRNEISTPSATSEKIRPISSAPSIEI